MTEREPWEAALMEYTYGDHDEHMVRLARWVYACAIRDAMAKCHTYAVDPRRHRLGAHAAWECKDIIAALMPKDAP